MSDNEVESPVEKPTKPKKDWVMTEARRLTLEKGRKVRNDNILKIQKDKAVQGLEKRKQSITAKINEKQSKIIEGLVAPKVKKPRQKIGKASDLAKQENEFIKEVEPLVEKVEEDESEEDYTSSESSVEIVIKRKPRKPITESAPYLCTPNPPKHHFFL